MTNVPKPPSGKAQPPSAKRVVAQPTSVPAPPVPSTTPIPLSDKGVSNGHSNGSPHIIQPPEAPSSAPVSALTPVQVDPRYAPYRAVDDPALIMAWRRFLDYDFVSSDRKWAHIHLRSRVIWLSFATSAVAVLSTFGQAWETTGYSPLALTLLDIGFFILRLSLVVMPILSVGMMSYASQFASSTSWIEYRVSAEIIRQHIYLYRMGAGRFKGLSQQAAQRELIRVVNIADARLARKRATIPDMRLNENQLSNAELAEAIKRQLNAGDDGFSLLSADQYTDLRVKTQIAWYVKRIENDYKALRNTRVQALFVSGIGAVIAAVFLNFEGLVAITTALGTALSLRNDTRMFGATYGIYHLTARRLQNRIVQWNVLSQQEKGSSEEIDKLVSDTERLFYEEIRTWRDTAVQMQASTEQSLQNMLRNPNDKNGEPDAASLADTSDDLEELLGAPQGEYVQIADAQALILTPEDGENPPIAWHKPATAPAVPTPVATDNVSPKP